MKTKILFCLFVPIAGIFSCNKEERQFDASGSFEAIETILSAKANGQILQLNIQEGQALQPGQIIGYIDSTQLHVSRLQLMQNKKAILSGKPQINIQSESLKKQLASAILERDRAQRLVNGGVASQKQLDDANAKVATIQAQINAQENSLQTSTQTLNEQGNTVSTQLQGIDEQLNNCVIVNPLKGVVLAKYAEQYEMTTTGKPLYKIADIDTLDLRAYITGTQLPQIKMGQQVNVLIDQGKKAYKEYTGNIIWISPKSEFSPKSIQTKDERANLVYAIKIRVKNDGYLKIGMYGEVVFSDASKKSSMVK